MSRRVVLNIRLPRIAAALLVGAALAGAGTAFQGLFRNPLVSPDILGASSGAALGAVIGIYLSLGVYAIQACAFAGGLAAVALVYTIGSAAKGRDPLLVLVLAGVVIGALFGAGVSAAQISRRSLQPASRHHVLAARQPGQHEPRRSRFRCSGRWCSIGLVPLFLLRWRMNVMSLAGRGGARAGRADRTVALHHCRGGDARDGRASCRSAASSAGSGWSFRMPRASWSARISRGCCRPRCCSAAGYLLAIDTLARSLASIEIPLGVLTAVVGTPFFLWILAGVRRSWQ